MNDPKLAIEKLEMLAREAPSAKKEYEKAALFSAVRWLASDIEADSPEFLHEDIERVRWSICAMLGYDTLNGHTIETHLAWAIGAITTLKARMPQS
jgi:hypothetical protein